MASQWLQFIKQYRPVFRQPACRVIVENEDGAMCKKVPKSVQVLMKNIEVLQKSAKKCKKLQKSGFYHQEQRFFEALKIKKCV